MSIKGDNRIIPHRKMKGGPLISKAGRKEEEALAERAPKARTASPPTTVDSNVYRAYVEFNVTATA